MEPQKPSEAIKAASSLMLRGPVVDVLKCGESPTFFTEEERVVILASDWEVIKAGLGAFANELTSATEALNLWTTWDYEVRSARVTGESIYTFGDFKRMREAAVKAADAVLEAVS